MTAPYRLPNLSCAGDTLLRQAVAIRQPCKTGRKKAADSSLRELVSAGTVSAWLRMMTVLLENPFSSQG